MPTHFEDTGELGEKAPRPVDAETVARGAFDHLEKGQGAVRASAKHRAHESDGRDNEEGEPAVSRRTLAIVCGVAVVVIAIIVVIFIRILDGPTPQSGKTAEVEQTLVAADQGITSHGSSYKLEQKDGVYQLVEVHEADNGQSVVLGELKGTPVSLVLYNGSLIIPQNLSDGKWDVMAFTIGSGWSQLADKDGNAVGGSGSIGQATLEGTNLVLTIDGTRNEIPLEW